MKHRTQNTIVGSVAAVSLLAALSVSVATAKTIKPKAGQFNSSDTKIIIAVSGGKIRSISAACTFTATGVRFPMVVSVNAKVAKSGKFSFKTPDRSNESYMPADPMTVSGKFTSSTKAKIKVTFDLAGKCTPGSLSKTVKRSF